jgi:ABC-2 type transport system permease protein
MNMESTQMGARQENAAMATTISPLMRFYWSVRRELWEYRSLYLAPLIIAGLFLLAFVVGEMHSSHLSISASDGPPQDAPFPHHGHMHVAVGPYTLAAYVFMAVYMILSVFYCLDALYGERRDRSILFWKSLPVSDVIAVLAKASIPLLLLPLFTFALTIVTQWLMLLLSSVIAMARGADVSALWAQVPLFQMSIMLFFHLMAIHGLQFSAAYCWLLLVSAWARRAPILWAVLPPVVIVVAEKIAFNTHYFGRLLNFLLGGGPDAVAFTEGKMDIAPLTAHDALSYFSYPGLWAGLAVAVLLLAATVRVRRSREPI